VSEQTTWCYGESVRIPLSELARDAEGKILKPAIHAVDPPHFLNGITIKQRQTPGTFLLTSRNLESGAPLSFDPDTGLLEWDGPAETESASIAERRLRRAFELYRMALKMPDSDLEEIFKQAEDRLND
jgi:hypothetical protein